MGKKPGYQDMQAGGQERASLCPACMRPCLLQKAHFDSDDQASGPAPRAWYSRAWRSFGIRSPRLTVPEVLTYPQPKEANPLS